MFEKGGETMEILDRMKHIIANQLGIDEDEVTPEFLLWMTWVLTHWTLSN